MPVAALGVAGAAVVPSTNFPPALLAPHGPPFFPLPRFAAAGILATDGCPGQENTPRCIAYSMSATERSGVNGVTFSRSAGRAVQ